MRRVGMSPSTRAAGGQHIKAADNATRVACRLGCGPTSHDIGRDEKPARYWRDLGGGKKSRGKTRKRLWRRDSPIHRASLQILTESGNGRCARVEDAPRFALLSTEIPSALLALVAMTPRGRPLTRGTGLVH
jgi:hypothetical protein